MEVGAVNFIHGAEIPQILHKYCRLDDIVQRQTGLLQHSLQILERLVRLGLHALGQCAGGGVQAELAAAIDGVTGVNGLGIGAQGGGCVRGSNTLHNNKHSSILFFRLVGLGRPYKAAPGQTIL